MNILFVEDHPALRYGIAREMRANGHTVHEAADSETALAALAEHEVDVLVTDLGLPGMSGDVFAAEARALRPSIRIIFATGKNDIPDSHGESGDPILLRKPYDWKALEAALGSCG